MHVELMIQECADLQWPVNCQNGGLKLAGSD